MDQDTKNQLKTMTDNVRVKLTDAALFLQGVIDNPADLASQLGTQIELCHDLKHSLDQIDEFIDAQ